MLVWAFGVTPGVIFERILRMLARFPLFLILVLGIGCKPKAEAAEATARPESRATEMPESLRCARATDCVPASSCRWSTPSCVAAASVVDEKCEDGDPEDKDREKFTCGCQEGQCVAQTQ